MIVGIKEGYSPPNFGTSPERPDFMTSQWFMTKFLWPDDRILKDRSIGGRNAENGPLNVRVKGDLLVNHLVVGLGSN